MYREPVSSNDGCVVSRSNEAKGLAIKMGQPLFQIQSIVRTHDVQYFSSNFSLYSDMSWRIMQIITELVPSIEVYSSKELPSFHVATGTFSTRENP